jgi:hypothetical protein
MVLGFPTGRKLSGQSAERGANRATSSPTGVAPPKAAMGLRCLHYTVLRSNKPKKYKNQKLFKVTPNKNNFP